MVFFGNLFFLNFKLLLILVPPEMKVIENAIANAGLQKTDIDWLVMHQANQRIIDASAERLGLTPDRVVSNLSEFGNTSAASIPLALDGAVRNGSIKKGDKVRGALSPARSLVRALCIRESRPLICDLSLLPRCRLRWPVLVQG